MKSCTQGENSNRRQRFYDTTTTLHAKLNEQTACKLIYVLHK